jgi:hypothetical protein
MTKLAGSGSTCLRHGSADPDPHQNVIDPEHCRMETNLGGSAVGTAADDSGQRNGEKGGEEAQEYVEDVPAVVHRIHRRRLQHHDDFITCEQ